MSEEEEINKKITPIIGKMTLDLIKDEPKEVV